jgi:hypothetical protein
VFARRGQRVVEDEGGPGPRALEEGNAMSQEWSLTPGAQAPVKRKGKGAIITGVVLMVVALVMGIVGVVGIIAAGTSAVSAFASPVLSPATSSNQLDGGKNYVVYQLTDSTSTRITSADIAVTAPDGSTVSVTDITDSSGTYSSNGDTFVTVASFTAPVSGVYSTSVAVPGELFVVGPGLSALTGLALWGLLIGLATILGIIGLVVLIVGVVRRSSSKPKPVAYGYPAAGVAPVAQPYVAPAQTPQPQIFEQPTTVEPVQPYVAPTPTPAPAQATPPAGWYPDPSRPGGQRYWDGGQWTEHQA